MLADLIVAFHFLFVVFVVMGGFLVLRWPWVAYLHVPAAVWGVLIELAGWICPLTPLEKRLRVEAGGAGYQGGFIENYILPVLYPSALTRGIQIFLGSLVLILNVAVYWHLWSRSRRAATA